MLLNISAVGEILYILPLGCCIDERRVGGCVADTGSVARGTEHCQEKHRCERRGRTINYCSSHCRSSIRQKSQQEETSRECCCCCWGSSSRGSIPTEESTPGKDGNKDYAPGTEANSPSNSSSTIPAECGTSRVCDAR